MQEYVKTKLKGFSVITSPDKITEKNLDPQTNILAVFVEAPVTKKIIESLPSLKMIATMSTGFDHIDLDTAKNTAFRFVTCRPMEKNTVAEHAMALILGLTRKLFPSVKRVKEGVYDFHGLRGVDIKGKTIGVIGTGHIGMHLIKMLSGFEAKIVAYDAFPNKDRAKEFGFTYLTLEKLLASSDIISLHTPLLPSTRHLINKKNVKKIKKGAYLINTARGALVEPEAIVWALQNNHLAGVGLDVLEDENLIQNYEEVISCKDDCKIKTTMLNNIIIDHPNSIVTPHNAFNSTEGNSTNFGCYDG
jgi:D-lactate dehydrogenase